jgi:CheY-like chemotaxis protein
MIYALPLTHPVGSSSQRTILVVDDEPPILMLVRDVLEEDGYAVLTASNAEDGLTIACNKPIALILTDLMMPQMDGIAFSAALRNQPHTAHVPILLMSAVMPAQLDEHFDGFVAKPFAIDQLVNEVDGHLLSSEQAAAA